MTHQTQVRYGKQSRLNKLSLICCMESGSFIAIPGRP